ncbi:T9SS type A sorting domain-containing protein [Gelidibacter salicanalis]|uniref:T9SS type A sorting domain-containing protein n=1 Tax=Gelidibacter salicanalis TaxID=291193 RepID=A0A934NJ81_9FLAO|nr:T9SS type A sorting domain-containing protein [Gelidibacter salicanalis]MBJ7883036.1 T9SS type A sorting domain-containing protein [Gelidibacter salicanalis]
MKSKIHLLTILITFCIYNTYGQITTTLDEVYVNGQTSVTNCGTIDFETTENNTLTFYYTLTKTSSSTGEGFLKIKLKYNSSSNGAERGNQYITSNLWNSNQYVHTIATNIDASEVQVNGSSIYLEFTEVSSPFDYYNSCEHPIIKTPVPSFSLTPNSTTVSCESTSVKNFTVTPSNIPNGATVTYQWNVGNGWLRNGNPASNFTTSTPSVTLTPNAFPPGNVNVTPVLNGDSYPTLTSAVSLGSFNPVYQISGVNGFCTTATYTVNNLLSGTSVTSWSVSNNNIATISSNGNQATLTAVGSGLVSISANITNSCGQSKPFHKINIVVGNPYFPNIQMTGIDEVVEDQIVHYSVPIASGATSYQWSFNYLGSGNPTIPSNNWQILSGQGSRSISVKVGSRSNTVVVICKAINSCGNTTKYKDVSVTGIDDNCVGDNPCYGTTRVNSNPMKAGFSTNIIEYIPNPNNKNAKAGTENYTLEVFNQFNVNVYSKKQNNPIFNLNNLNKGFYIVKLITDKGHVLTEKIIIE